MRLSLRANVALVLTLAISMLGVRIIGVHTHLCLDGKEARATVHLADAGIHDEHAPGEEHSDLNVEPDGALAKSAKGANLDLPFLATAVALLVRLAPVDARHPPSTIVESVLPAFRFIRPPLRAPPL